MYKKIFYAALLLFVCSSLSCKDSGVTPNSSDKPIATSFEFLKIGNQWKYVEEDIDESSNTSRFDTTILTIKSTNNGYYTVEEKESSMYISEVEYWYGDMEKWAIESNPTKSIQGIPLIFQNCTVGQKWKGHDDDGDGDIYNIEVMSVNEEVQTPAGLFKNCIKVKVVEADDINDAKYFWINPKCGVVKKVDGNDITLLYEKNF